MIKKTGFNILAVSLFSLLATSITSIPNAASDTFPGTNGLICFESDRDGNSEIYTMDGSGGNVNRLTNNSVTDAFCAMSPDGTKIVYTSSSQITIINSDGTGSPTTVTGGSSPSWSADGTKIVFSKTATGGANDIFVINADGTNETQLTTTNEDERAPSFSPDGTKIAIAKDSDGSTSTSSDYEIFIINADGSGTPTQLTTNSVFDSEPSWSPDGTKIIYGSNGDVIQINSDGSGSPTNLTNSPGVTDFHSTYSPDGTKIAYMSNQPGNFDIFVMDSDGSNPTNISGNAERDASPNWGPAATLDTVPPTGAITHDDADGFISATTPNITITATFSEAMDPSTNVNLEVFVDGTLGATLLMTPTTSTVYTATLAGAGGDGPITFSFSSGKDVAGNTVVSAPTSSQSLSADNTGPVLTATASTDPNVHGWYKTDVSVDYVCDDTGGSGINAASFTTPLVVSTEGLEQSSPSQQCEDNVGNLSNSAQVTGINIDKTTPTISGAITPTPNVSGWNNEDATVSWVCSDSLSGPDLSTVTVPSTQTTETSGAVINGDCDDLAGNSAAQGSVTVKLDKTPPTVVAPAPTTQRTEAVTQNAALTPVDYDDYVVIDPLSGVASSSCTDDDDDSTVSTTSGSFSKGITTVTCHATDVADNTNSDTVFKIAIAEVLVTEICVTGVSTSNAETCVGVSPDGIGTTTVDALWGNPDLVTIRGIIYGYQTPTDVTSLDVDWGTNDPGSDSIGTVAINALDGNEDDGASFEFTHNYAGPGTAAGEYTSPESIIVTMTGSTFTSNTNAQVSVQKHATDSTLVLAASSEKWDHTLASNTITLTDTSEEPDAGVANKVFDFSGDSVAAGQSATTSDGSDSDALGTRTTALQAGTATAAQNGPTYPVTATFTEDDFYLGSSDSQDLTLDPHIITLETTADSEAKWDHVFNMETTITDTEFVSGTDSGAAATVDLRTITYSGPGVAGEDDQSHQADTQLVGGTATTGPETLQAGEAADSTQTPSPDDIVSTIINDFVYTGAASPATHTTQIDLRPHDTTTSLDPLVDLVAGTAFTPSGLVTDNNRILNDDPAIRTALGCDPAPAACDNFVNFDTGSFTNEIVRLEGTGLFDEFGNPIASINAVLQGVSVNDPNGGFTQFNGIDVLQLFDGGKLIVSTGAITNTDEDGVILDIRNLDVGDTATFTVTTSNPNDDPFEVVVEGTDQPNFVSILITEESGISEIEFTPTVDDVTDVQISAIRISNPEGDPPIFFEVDFSTVEDAELLLVNGQATFLSGSFEDIIVTPSEEDTNLTVQAFFDATDQYNESQSAVEEFDTLFQSWGVGGQNVAIAPDSGQGFTSVSCSSDTDGDAICDNWENDGFITYSVGGSNTANWVFPVTEKQPGVIVPGPDVNRKDVYVEIDYMGPESGLSSDVGHFPSDTVIRDVVLAFEKAPTKNPTTASPTEANGINLHILRDDKLTHVSNLNVWTDNDNNLTNDFNSIKSRFFGTVNERTTLGAQTTTINNVDADTNNLVISGITITTPSAVAKTKGTITMQARVVFNGDPGTITIEDAARSGSSNSATFFISAGFIGEEFTQDFSQPNAFIFTIKAPFSDTDTAANPTNFGIGTFTLPINTSNPVSVVAASSGTYRNSPTVSTTLLDSKAQVFHYVLIAHSIGACGPSGVAEYIGNDVVISLGCDFSGAEQGIAPTDANGHANTVGSRWEFDGTFMHELGHNLGLQHGGGDNINCKPNYESVMSYSRQTPLFLGTPFPVQYSSGLLPSLNENAALEEFIGLQRTGAHGKIVYAGSGGSARITTTYDNILNRIGIDWNDNSVIGASGVLTSADINNFEISGCGPSPNQFMSDYDDWNGMNFNFRGAGGSAFDGFKSDPRKTAEVTDTLVNELEGTLDWYNGILAPVPRDGSGAFKIGSTIPLKFELFSCNPADVLCVDVDGLAGDPETPTGDPDEEIMTEFTDADKQIFLQVKKFAGGVTSSGEEIIAEDGISDVGFFRHTGEHFIFNWDTKQLLDPHAKGKAKQTNLAEAAGTYALRFIELQDGIQVGFMVDRYEENGIKLFEQRLPNDLDLDGDGLADDDADELVTIILKLTP